MGCCVPKYSGCFLLPEYLEQELALPSFPVGEIKATEDTVQPSEWYPGPLSLPRGLTAVLRPLRADMVDGQMPEGTSLQTPAKDTWCW